MFAILKWLPNYSPKKQFLGDIYGGELIKIGGNNFYSKILGLMLACNNIPLGIACSNLAGVPGINGLYTILLASFIYPIFSDWPHGTVGRFY